MTTKNPSHPDRGASANSTQLKRFSVAPFYARKGQWVGHSPEGHPVVILEVDRCDEREIQLNHMHLTSAARCEIDYSGEKKQITACVIECKVTNKVTEKFFLDTMGQIFQGLDYPPKPEDVHRIIEEARDIFAKLATSSSEAILGFAGELLFILLCKDSVAAVRAWHVNDSDIMDFTFKAVQIEVKTTSYNTHRHTITYEQLQRTGKLPAHLLSFKVEESDNGMTINDIKERLEEKLSSSPMSLKKIREKFASVVGTQIEKLPKYNMDYVLHHARLYPIDEVPGIRGELPYGCSQVKFESLLDEKGGLAIMGKQPMVNEVPELERRIDALRL